MDERQHEFEEMVRQLHAQRDYHDAVTRIVDVYGRRLFGFFGQRLGESDAKDAYADFLLKLWRTFPDFRWEGSLAGWLFRVANTTAIDAIRRVPSRVDPLPDNLSHAPELRDWARSLTSVLDERRQLRRISELMINLSDTDREILALEAQALPMSEIAAILGIGDNTASQRLHRARQRLGALARAAGLVS